LNPPGTLVTSASAPTLTSDGASNVELVAKAIVPPSLPFCDPDGNRIVVATTVQSKEKAGNYSKSELVNKYGCFAHPSKSAVTMAADEVLVQERVTATLSAAAAAA
jgi:hypothetical protein